MSGMGDGELAELAERYREAQENSQVQALIKAIVDVLDLPYPAEDHWSAAHDRLLVLRMCELRGVLKAALENSSNLKIAIRVITEIPDGLPVTYRTKREPTS